MTSERVEFVEPAAVPGGGGDEIDTGGGHGPGGRRGLVVVVGVVLALVAALLVGRLVTDDAPRQPTPTASPTPGVFRRTAPPQYTPRVGLVGLPRLIGEPRELVAARSGDVVWMVDRGAGIVRIEAGNVTAVQLLESQVTAIAVSPSGDRLYVATAANRPSIQVLNATTLALGRSRPLEASIQAMAVSIDAVWAASGSNLFRLDLDSLDALDTLPMPDVVLTSHLRIQTDLTAGNQEYVIGLATGGNDDGTTTSRFVRVNPLTREVLFGAPIAGASDMATSAFRTWVTTSASPPVTEGFDSVVDPAPSATATPPLAAGSRIWDSGGAITGFLAVGPHSSVISCRDDAGYAKSEVDVAPSVPDARITGQVLRTDAALYVVTDRGLVRSGVGSCSS